MSDHKKYHFRPGSLSIIIPFPSTGELTKSMNFLEHLQVPIYAGVPIGSTEDLPEIVQPILFEKIGNQSWRLSDCSSIQTEWVLFIEQNEFLERKILYQLAEALPSLAKFPHSMAITRFLPVDQIKQFDWVTTRQVFSVPSANMLAYHPMELRLIPAIQLDSVTLKTSAGRMPSSRFRLRVSPDGGKVREKKFIPLSISRLEPSSQEDPWEQPEDKEIFAKGHAKFFDDVRFVEEFHWPRTLYLLIRTEHVPTILKGLKEGITSRGIVMHTLHYLLRLGKFELATQFLPFIPEHWEFGDPVITQMKAIAHFFAGEAKAAQEVFEKCYARTPEEPAISENMGKFLLLLGEEERASEFFQKSLDNLKDSKDGSHIHTFLQTLKENSGHVPTLTACIICKDEEKLLPRALQSLAGLADETVVVDTGSHDQSREIARHFGARVFDLRWEDDFSKARNFALEQATSDYVLMLDADEYLFASNLIDFHVMKRLLPVKSPRAFAVAIGHFKVETDWINVLTGGGNFITESRAIRIIPRLSGVQHQGTVEESVVDSLSKLNIPVTTLPEDQMRIHHDVLDRERRILRKMRAYDRETDPNLVQLVAAVRDFSYAGDRDGTVRWLKRLVDAGIKEALPLIGRMGIRLVRLIEDESPGEAGQILEDLRTLFPEDRKFTLALSSHFIRNGYFADLSTLDFGQITEAGLRIPNEDLEYWIHGGIAALEGGNINDAACILDHVLSQHSDNLLGQVARFYFFSRIGHLEDATSTLEDLLDITIGRYTTQIMTPTEFLNIVEQLSDTLGRWGHAVERSLLLYGSLALKEKLEVNT